MAYQGSPRHQMHIDPAVAGPLLMLSAALLFTLLNLIIKLLGPQYTVWHIGFFRFFGGIVAMTLIFGRHRDTYRGHNIRLLILRGCSGSAGFLAMITAVRLLPLSTALVLFYSYPAFAAIWSFLIYRERVGFFEIACIAAVAVGVMILFDFRLTGGIWGQTMAIVGGVCAGLTVTLIRSLRARNGPVVIYLYYCTMGTLLTLPHFILKPVWPASAAEGVMILGIVIISMTSQLLMNQGFFYCRGWEGGVFMSGEVIFTAIVGVVFLGDPLGWRLWSGGLIIFSSVVALNYLRHSRTAKR